MTPAPMSMGAFVIITPSPWPLRLESKSENKLLYRTNLCVKGEKRAIMGQFLPGFA
jgi:hypothetical protein